MAFDAGLTPLPDTDVVTRDQVSALTQAGISTLEELASTLVDDPDAVAAILGSPSEQMAGLRDRVLGRLDPSIRDALRAPRTRYPTGALPPTERQAP